MIMERYYRYYFLEDSPVIDTSCISGAFQRGSARLTAGEKLAALLEAGDEKATAFERSITRHGFCLDYNRSRGWKKICCISTAFKDYLRAGNALFEKGLQVLWLAWRGHPDSLRHEILDCIIRFLEIYDEEIDECRLIKKLSAIEPIQICKAAKEAGGFSGYRRYLYQIYLLYIGDEIIFFLPRKF